MDLSFITPRLAVGGANVFADGNRHHQLTHEDVRNLRHVGITHALSVREYGEQPDVMQPLTFAWYEMANEFGAFTPQLVDACLRFAHQPLLGGGKLYIYCNEGLDRSPSVAYAVLRSLGHSGGEALNKLRSARPQVRVPYIPWVDQVLPQIGVR